MTCFKKLIPILCVTVMALSGCADNKDDGAVTEPIPTLSAATSAEEETQTETETQAPTAAAAPVSAADTEAAAPEPDIPEDIRDDVLVVYFSATGNTQKIAGYISDSLGCDSYAVIPDVPYTSDDLDYNNPNSRSSLEMNFAGSRPDITGELPDLTQYDYIFLGYPIWWGQAPRIMCTFTESCSLSGKTVIPFCTSGSSDIGSSAANLAKLAAEDSEWLSGKRFGGGASAEEVSEWIASLDIPRITDYKSLYRKYLLKLAREDEYNGHQYFDLYDIDGDGTPELFISTDDYHLAQADIYTVWQGRVKELGDGYGSWGVVLAADNKYIDSSYTGTGSIFHSVFEKRGDEMINLKRFEYTKLEELICRINDADVTEEEYNEAFAEYDLDWQEVGRKYPINAEGISEALE